MATIDLYFQITGPHPTSSPEISTTLQSSPFHFKVTGCFLRPVSCKSNKISLNNYLLTQSKNDESLREALVFKFFNGNVNENFFSLSALGYVVDELLFPDHLLFSLTTIITNFHSYSH